MWQTYYTATSVSEALRLLAGRGPDARPIAGGTDLLIELQRGRRQAHALVDVTRIGGLDHIDLDSAGYIHIGPAVTHNQAAASGLLRERAFLLASACWQVGTPQIRNRATIAGNLVTASPANDTITALWALDARLTLRSTRGERSLSFPEFYQGVRQTALAADELVTDIAFPALAAGQRSAFLKLGLRRASAIAVANVAVVLTLEDSVVSQARIALGSVAPTIIRASEAEAVLRGGPLNEERIAQAAALAAQAAIPIDDIRAGAAYRREIVRVLVCRALAALRDGAERAALPAHLPMLWGGEGGRPIPLSGETLCHHDDGRERIECVVNGRPVAVSGAGGKTLLAMLRDDLGLTGAKEGCGEGECGACTIWMDGAAVLACLTPAPRAHGTHIVTVEGLARDGALHPLQQAFIDEGAVQCGYCTPGFLMAGANLLAEIPHPTREQIVAGLSGNLCRCTGYYKIIQAVERAAQDPKGLCSKDL